MQQKEFTLDSDLYNIDSLIQAADEFREYAEIRIESDDDMPIKITISSELDIEILSKEFFNFVLSF